LTWRDVQHLVVFTSDYERLANNPGWQENNIGLRFNSRFGFGVMNGVKLVETAKTWKNVPTMKTCISRFNVEERKTRKLNDNKGKEATLELSTDACKGTDDYVRYLEQVELVITLQYSHRGSLKIDLTSPKGTRTTILQPRWQDSSVDGFHDWKFASAHTWGEDPRGTWSISIQDMSGKNHEGRVTSYQLILHGTSTKPNHMNIKRKYSSKLLKHQEDVGSTHPNGEYLDLRKPDESMRLDWDDVIGKMIVARQYKNQYQYDDDDSIREYQREKLLHSRYENIK